MRCCDVGQTMWEQLERENVAENEMWERHGEERCVLDTVTETDENRSVYREMW